MAWIWVVPFACTTVLALDNVMVDSCGASSGTLSHATASTAAKPHSTATRRFLDRASPAMMESIREEMSNCNSLMNLAPKASDRLVAFAQSGYAMAALLVAMSVMAIVLSAAMPVWSQMIRRDKEEELI